MKMQRPMTRTEHTQLAVSLGNFIEDAPESSYKEDALSALSKFEALKTDISPSELLVTIQALKSDLSLFESLLKQNPPYKKRSKLIKMIGDIRSLLHKFHTASFE